MCWYVRCRRSIGGRRDWSRCSRIVRGIPNFIWNCMLCSQYVRRVWSVGL